MIGVEKGFPVPITEPPEAAIYQLIEPKLLLTPIETEPLSHTKLGIEFEIDGVSFL